MVIEMAISSMPFLIFGLICIIISGSSLYFTVCNKLERRGLSEQYSVIYFHICELFSPDDGTRPPGTSALMVPNDDCMAA